MPFVGLTRVRNEPCIRWVKIRQMHSLPGGVTTAMRPLSKFFGPLVYVAAGSEYVAQDAVK